MNCSHACFGAIEKYSWIDAHKKHQKQERYDESEFACIQIFESRILVVCNLSKDDTLKHPQHVNSRPNNSGSGEHRKNVRMRYECRSPRANQNQELTYKPIQEWQAN